MPPARTAAATNAASAISSFVTPGLARLPRVGVDAVGAQRGEGGAESDQSAVLARGGAIASFDGVVEGEERLAFDRASFMDLL